MSNVQNSVGIDPEIEAIAIVYRAIAALDSPAQQRVLQYVASKLGHSVATIPVSIDTADGPKLVTPMVEPPHQQPGDSTGDDDLGISPVALKWMRRNNLGVNQLSAIFSLGVDEIDLVAKAIPGKGKKERCLNVVLLKGIAEYLASGAPRITQEQIKETCLHYDAFDATNFAANLKSFSGDLSGTKASGFTLTARGLTNATELIKSLVQTS